MEEKQGLSEKAAQSLPGPNPVIGLNRKSIFDTFKTLALKAATQPVLGIRHQLGLLNELADIIQNKSSLTPDAKDRRFTDVSWENNPFYKSSLQSYLALVKEMNDWVEKLNLNKVDEDRSKFVISLLTEAIAPSNWITNPSALKRVIETGGRSWVNGMKNILHDLVYNKGLPSQVDKEGFQVGENLAVTKGKVIFKTEVLELIQYQPTTEKVYRRPILMVPPQINKYYIFDLSKGKSLVDFLVNEGYQVFMISWYNPSKEQGMWDLETYVTSIEKAIQTTKDICKIKNINVWGACSGGITLSATLAFLAAKKDSSIHAASFVVSMLDVSDAKDTSIGLFADDASIDSARDKSHRQGVLKGDEMSSIFSWMRPNDLIWNYWVSNYLHGNKPPQYDILYWNADTTNLPACLHSDYLDLFKENYLAKKGVFKIGKYPIDLSKVNCEMYFVAGLTDHITPWKVCYQSLKLFDTKSTFILGNKGHIQTILNPPGNLKGKFYINEKADCQKLSSEEWMTGATEQTDSWWFHFSKWLESRSEREKFAPKKLGNKNYLPLYNAPGQYVF